MRLTSETTMAKICLFPHSGEGWVRRVSRSQMWESHGSESDESENESMRDHLHVNRSIHRDALEI